MKSGGISGTAANKDAREEEDDDDVTGRRTVLELLITTDEVIAGDGAEEDPDDVDVDEGRAPITPLPPSMTRLPLKGVLSEEGFRFSE